MSQMNPLFEAIHEGKKDKIEHLLEEMTSLQK